MAARSSSISQTEKNFHHSRIAIHLCPCGDFVAVAPCGTFCGVVGGGRRRDRRYVRAEFYFFLSLLVCPPGSGQLIITKMGMGAQPLNVLTEGLTDNDDVFFF